MDKQSRTAQRKRLLIEILIFAAILLGVSFYRSSGQATARVDWREDSVTVTQPDGESWSFQYAELICAELANCEDFGEKTGGEENRSYRYGLWHNALWGDYLACIGKDCTQVMHFQTAQGHYVIGLESDTTTAAIFESLASYFP